MRIVLATAGTAGDINPFIAVALELRQRGHHAIIASHDEFRVTVEDEGLGFRAVRPSVADIERELGLAASELVERASRRALGLGFAVRGIAMRFLRRGLEDMLSITQGADVVVTHTSAFAARLAAEARGLPWFSAVLAPFSFMSAFDPPVFSDLRPARWLREVTGGRSDAAVLNLARQMTGAWTGEFRRVRHELGLPPCANPLFEGQFSTHGTLGLFSPFFAPIQPDYPQPCKLTGFCLFDRQHGIASDPSPELCDFLAAGPPPVVFSLGSTLVLDPGDFFQTSVKIARRLSVRAILLTGATEPTCGMRDESILEVPYARHSQIFPQARAIIHHGGIGTTAQALVSGVPQLLVPFTADQPDNAERIVRLGVGRSVSLASYGHKGIDEATALLQDDYAQRAQSLAKQMAKEDGPEAAADAIEQWLVSERACAITTLNG